MVECVRSNLRMRMWDLIPPLSLSLAVRDGRRRLGKGELVLGSVPDVRVPQRRCRLRPNGPLLDDFRNR